MFYLASKPLINFSFANKAPNRSLRFIFSYGLLALSTFNLFGCRVSEPAMHTLEELTQVQDRDQSSNSPNSITSTKDPSHSTTNNISSSNTEARHDSQDLKVCIPSPTIFKSHMSFAPKLYNWVNELKSETCTLDHDQVKITNNFMRLSPAFGSAHHEECDDQGCWITLPSIAKTWSESKNPNFWLFDRGTTLWKGVIDARYHRESGETHAKVFATYLGTSALNTLERRWDKEGHILEETFSFNHSPWFRSRYIWSADHLMSVEVSDLLNRNSNKRFEFNYSEDGKLVSATMLRETGTSQHSHWQYDEQGRPSAVDRFVARPESLPVLWLSQRWSYNESGHLSEHQNVLHTDFASDVLFNDPLDDHQPSVQYSQIEASEASLHSDNHRECWKLPSGLEAGYGFQTEVYNLGWSLADRPVDLDLAHGFERGYLNRSQGWFAHYGVQGDMITESPTVDLARYLHEGISIVHNKTQYENQHPQYEITLGFTVDQVSHGQAGFTSLINNEASIEGQILTERTWLWEDALLMEDELRLGQNEARRFTFSYDEHQRITSRQLIQGEEMIAQHNWEYQPNSLGWSSQCQIAGYSIQQNSQLLGIQDHPFMTHTNRPHQFGGISDVNGNGDMHIAFHTEIDETCREYKLEIPYQVLLEIHRDENDLITFQDGRKVSSHFGLSHFSAQYDPNTQLPTQIHILNQFASLHTAFNFDYDEEARLLSHNNREAQTESLNYICE